MQNRYVICSNQCHRLFHCFVDSCEVRYYLNYSVKLKCHIREYYDETVEDILPWKNIHSLKLLFLSSSLPVLYLHGFHLRIVL